MDGSIDKDKSRRERSLRGPRKKVNDLGICWSWFVAKLAACYLKSSSLSRVEQSRDWNVLLSQRWGEVKVARDMYVQERGLWSTVEKQASKQDHKHPSIPWVELWISTCLLVYIELALSLVGLYCKALVSAVHLNCRPLITTINELALVLSIEGKLFMAFWLVCLAFAAVFLACSCT